MLPSARALLSFPSRAVPTGHIPVYVPMGFPRVVTWIPGGPAPAVLVSAVVMGLHFVLCLPYLHTFTVTPLSSFHLEIVVILQQSCGEPLCALLCALPLRCEPTVFPAHPVSVPRPRSVLCIHRHP